MLHLPQQADLVMAARVLRSLLETAPDVGEVAVHVGGTLQVVTSRRVLDRLGYTRGSQGDGATLPGEPTYVALRYRCPQDQTHPGEWRVFGDARAASSCTNCGASLVRAS
jgi:hypothetical protein